MKFPPDIEVVGDTSFRGDCPAELAEQITTVQEIRRRWPDTLGRLVLHHRGEGKRDHRTFAKERAEGLCPGASDIIIPGNPCIVLELKRKDNTKSRLPPAELEFLRAAQSAGARVCIALGWQAAISFVERFHRSVD